MEQTSSNGQLRISVNGDTAKVVMCGRTHHYSVSYLYSRAKDEALTRYLKGYYTIDELASKN